jgi:hypothetical protein
MFVRNIVSFLKSTTFEKKFFTGVNDHFQSDRDGENGIFWLTLCVNFDRLAEFIFFFS